MATRKTAMERRPTKRRTLANASAAGVARPVRTGRRREEQSFLEAVVEMANSIPEEELDRLPQDVHAFLHGGRVRARTRK